MQRTILRSVLHRGVLYRCVLHVFVFGLLLLPARAFPLPDRAALLRDLSTLTGPEFEGRKTGEPGQARAAAFLARSFRSAGLVPLGTDTEGDFLDAVRLTRNQTTAATISTSSGLRSLFVDFQLTTRTDTGGWVERPLIAPEDDEAWEGVRPGDAVLVRYEAGLQATLRRAEQCRADSLFLVVPEGTELSVTLPEIQAPGREFRGLGVPLFLLRRPLAQEIAGVEPTDDDAWWASMRDDGPRTVRYRVDRREGDFVSHNVVGRVVGADSPEEIVLVSAHYDQLGVRGEDFFPGADDNASGVAALLELARAVSRRAASDRPPRRTLVLAAFTGEEQGILGSEAFATSGAIDLSHVVAHVNLDMIGRGDERISGTRPPSLYVLGPYGTSPTFERLVEEASSTSGVRTLPYSRGAGPHEIYRRSDQWSLARRGIPAILLFSGLHEDYDRPTDTADGIDVEAWTRRVAFVGDLVDRLLNATQSIRSLEPAPDWVREARPE